MSSYMDSRLSKLRMVARTMAVERTTTDLAVRFEDAMIDYVVLKGPVFAHWLYDNPVERTYGDSDLLVPPGHFDSAEKLLGELGFEPYWRIDFPNKRPITERDWRRPSDDARVDLHKTLQGVSVSPSEAWAVLSAHITRMELAGRSFNVLDEVANSLHAVLHVAQHGHNFGHPQRDLERVLARTKPKAWEEVKALAEKLGATEWLGSGLRMTEPGEKLAASLDLSPHVSTATALRRESAPFVAETLLWLEELPSWRARLAYLVRAAFPSITAMKTAAPVGKSGRHRVLVAYLLRWKFLARNLPLAVRAWRKAKKDAASQ